jgi:hypothetical protein
MHNVINVIIQKKKLLQQYILMIIMKSAASNNFIHRYAVNKKLWKVYAIIAAIQWVFDTWKG